jgi:hypothetical protein
MVPAATPARRVCAHHPDRAGHATCMACRRVMCQECATTWDGIHYCVECLARRRHAAEGRTSWVGFIVVALACVALVAATARLMVWAGVTLAGLG